MYICTYIYIYICVYNTCVSEARQAPVSRYRGLPCIALFYPGGPLTNCTINIPSLVKTDSVSP